MEKVLLRGEVLGAIVIFFSFSFVTLGQAKVTKK